MGFLQGRSVTRARPGGMSALTQGLLWGNGSLKDPDCTLGLHSSSSFRPLACEGGSLWSSIYGEGRVGLGKRVGGGMQHRKAPSRSAESQKDDLPLWMDFCRSPAAQVRLSLLEHAQMPKPGHHPHLPCPCPCPLSQPLVRCQKQGRSKFTETELLESL